MARKIQDSLRSARRRLTREPGAGEDAYLIAIDKALKNGLSELDTLLLNLDRERISELTDDAASAVAAATHSAAVASEAAGMAADAGMAKHFDVLGAGHQVSANRFRAWTLGTMGIGGFLAAIFLIGPSLGWSAFDIASGDYVHLAQRILLLAGVFGLAGYLGRQSHNHRTLANWALSLAAQLKTFDAYNNAIDDGDVRNELRRMFATRVFGDQPGLKGEATSPDGETIINKAADLVAKIMPGDK